MAFIQIIEFVTDRLNEVQALADEWRARTQGKRTAARSTLTADRERPGIYLQIVEFPSHEEAMANSNLPETTELAARLRELCTAPPTFRNLDVRRVEVES